jgi:hypothetical protein
MTFVLSDRFAKVDLGMTSYAGATAIGINARFCNRVDISLLKLIQYHYPVFTSSRLLRDTR